MGCWATCLERFAERARDVLTRPARGKLISFQGGLDLATYADQQLNAALGRNVIVKVETANPLRSFKGRGAEFFMSQIDVGADRPTVVCASTGTLDRRWPIGFRSCVMDLRDNRTPRRASEARAACRVPRGFELLVVRVRANWRRTRTRVGSIVTMLPLSNASTS